MLQRPPASPFHDSVNHTSLSDVKHGGRFTFDDGGTYSGDWLDGKAHGYGVCTGPKGRGEFAGAWMHGFEISGTYTWPSGNEYAGQWLDGRRHGLGVETHGRWTYCGEWSAGAKSRYGVRHSTASGSRYEGTWVGGLQDGFGVETYADKSTYQGQWLRGLRHGYGVRQSAPFDDATPFYGSNAATSKIANGTVGNGRGRRDIQGKKQHHKSLPTLSTGSTPFDDITRVSTRSMEDRAERTRSGFALAGPGTNPGLIDIEPLATSASTDGKPPRRRSRSASLRLSITDSFGLQMAAGKKNKMRASASDVFARIPTTADSSISSSTPEDLIETYAGEWRSDKRCGYGVSHRSDGLRFAGEWYNDQRCGYGIMAFQDGRTLERGKYRDNVIVKTDLGVSGTRKLLDFRLSKLKSRVETALLQAKKASELASQKSEMALSRRSTAKLKASEAEIAAKKAIEDSQLARKHSAEYLHQDPDVMTTSRTTSNDSDSAAGHQMAASMLTEQRNQLVLKSPSEADQAQRYRPTNYSSDADLHLAAQPVLIDETGSNLDYPVYHDSQNDVQQEVVKSKPISAVDVADCVTDSCRRSAPPYASASSLATATAPRRRAAHNTHDSVENARHSDSNMHTTYRRSPLSAKSSNSDLCNGVNDIFNGCVADRRISSASARLLGVRSRQQTPEKTDQTMAAADGAVSEYGEYPETGPTQSTTGGQSAGGICDRRVQPVVPSSSAIASGFLSADYESQSSAGERLTSSDTVPAASSRQRTSKHRFSDIPFIDNDEVIGVASTVSSYEATTGQCGDIECVFTRFMSGSRLTPSRPRAQDYQLGDVPVNESSTSLAERSPSGHRSCRPSHLPELLVEITDIDAVDVVPDDYDDEVEQGHVLDETSSNKLSGKATSLFLEPSTRFSNRRRQASMMLIELSNRPTDFGGGSSTNISGDRDQRRDGSPRRQSTSLSTLAEMATTECPFPAVQEIALRSAETSDRYCHIDELEHCTDASDLADGSPRRSTTTGIGVRQRHPPGLSSRSSLKLSYADAVISPVSSAFDRGKLGDQLSAHVTDSESLGGSNSALYSGIWENARSRDAGLQVTTDASVESRPLIDDLLEWCDRNPVTVLFLALNVLLAAIIYKLLASHMNLTR